MVQAGPTSPVELKIHARLCHTLKQVYPHVRSLSSHVPSYGSPWGFAIASRRPIDSRPDPEAIDHLLSEATHGGFRLMDGETLLGLLQTQAHIRKAIAEESVVYTKDAPPRFFGAGVQEQL